MQGDPGGAGTTWSTGGAQETEGNAIQICLIFMILSLVVAKEPLSLRDPAQGREREEEGIPVMWHAEIEILFFATQ